MSKPEQLARQTIDAALHAAGWTVQDHAAMNLSAGRGVAVREFPLGRGYGSADYLLYVDERVVGVIEAKKEGTTLTHVEVQTRKYAAGIPDDPPGRHPHPEDADLRQGLDRVRNGTTGHSATDLRAARRTGPRRRARVHAAAAEGGDSDA